MNYQPASVPDAGGADGGLPELTVDVTKIPTDDEWERLDWSLGGFETPISPSLKCISLFLHSPST